MATGEMKRMKMPQKAAGGSTNCPLYVLIFPAVPLKMDS